MVCTPAEACPFWSSVRREWLSVLIEKASKATRIYKTLFEL